MNGLPFRGAKRKVDPAILDIFYPPTPDENAVGYDESTDVAYDDGTIVDYF